jgi:cell division protein FtsW
MGLPDPFRPRSPAADATGVWVPAFVLVGLGLVGVYSFGARHVARQVAWAAIGTGACWAVSRVPLRLVRGAATAFFAAVAALLAACLLFAEPIAGTRRWIELPGGFGYLQPSELAKLAVVLFLARRLEERGREGGSVWVAAWPILPLCVLVLLAPDFGTTVYLAALAATMLFVAGAPLGRVVACGLAALPVLLLAAARFPYVAERLRFFQGERSYQLQQAELALASGGIIGNGLGAGRQKLGYLPAGHTDFVLPNLGEELGFVGVALVGTLFALILVHGVRVALAASRARDTFAFLAAFGATFLVVFQALLNIAVSTGAAPTKGISLPFLSQGGSNMLVSLLAIGLVANVGRSLEAKR